MADGGTAGEASTAASSEAAAGNQAEQASGRAGAEAADTRASSVGQLGVKQLAPGTGVSAAAWNDYFDTDGRIVAESRLRKAVFRGGVENSVRKECWKFILGAVPCSSTYREREVLAQRNRVTYTALKQRWKEVLSDDQMAGALTTEGVDPEDQFEYIQAKLSAMRHEIDVDAANAVIKAIQKDVPRTDRTIEYFRGDSPEHLQWLNDILVTFAIFNPEIGYAQGMNDVLSMILVVMDNEAEAFSCFLAFMKQFCDEFTADGMMKKLDGLIELLGFMDPQMFSHLQAIDAGDLVFCHRWLLLSFKREFLFDDALVMFEILCSHHLELSSMEADVARAQQIREDRERHMTTHDGTIDVSGKNVSDDQAPSELPPYTYSLFVAVAILKTYRENILSCTDVADIFQFINGLVEKMDLEAILAAAETVFFDYCRKSVTHDGDPSLFLLKD
eukprot:m.159259 g.159259  ORF g.159259 m.159259 type:complete len:446 (+) comp17606_c0_seq19:351-1688(+)